jgi:SAM-dependent methyltransferase
VPTGDVQGPLWSERARAWSELQEPHVSPLFEAALDALGPGAGRRLVDAGCGSGFAARLAAERDFVVAGFDAAPSMLEIARERTPAGDFRLGDLEQAPFPAGAFDVATAFNAVQYAGDHSAAVGELVRIVVPGGRITVGMWAEHDRSEMSDVFDTLGALMPPPPPGAPVPFALERPGALEALLEGAGIDLDAGADAPAEFVYPDFETAMRAQLSAGMLVRMEEIAGRDAVHDAMRGVLERYRREDGTVVFRNMFRFVSGTTRA